MDYLYERISYLKGLSDGLNIDENTKEGKLLLHIIDTLQDFADAISDLYDEQEDLIEYVDLMDQDLTDVENELFGECDDEEDYDYDEFDDDDFDFDDDEEIDYIEVECPNCKETIYIDEDLFNDEDTLCPNCHEILPNENQEK